MVTKKQYLFLLFLTIVPFLASQGVGAETVAFDFCEIPLELSLLEENATVIPENVVRIDTISQEHITHPSLWWTREQFNRFKGKLIANWLAYPEQKRIDLVVNRQLWTLMNYMEKYSFVNEFGTVAREYGYNLRVFNQYGKCLVTYQQFADNNQWKIDFKDSLQDSLQIEAPK